MIMKRKNRHRWLITAWFLIMGCTQLARAVTYTPTFVNTRGYNPEAYNVSIKDEGLPAYQFQSTSTSMESGSTYAPLVSAPFATLPGKMGGIRRGIGDPEGDPEAGGVDYEIGVIPDPTPVGEPWILLLLALVYLIYTVYKKKTILTK